MVLIIGGLRWLPGFKLFIPTKNGKLASFILPFWGFCHILYKADGRGVLTEPLAYILVLLQLL